MSTIIYSHDEFIEKFNEEWSAYLLIEPEFSQTIDESLCAGNVAFYMGNDANIYAVTRISDDVVELIYWSKYEKIWCLNAWSPSGDLEALGALIISKSIHNNYF